MHRLPAHAGEPQHRGGVFLNDFDQDTVVWEGMSNPIPGGSARKSAAIIPFVNESLTSGLPIDPGCQAFTTSTANWAARAAATGWDSPSQGKAMGNG